MNGTIGALLLATGLVIGAQVTDEAGNLIFTAFEPVAVITAGNPSQDVSVALVAVGS